MQGFSGALLIYTQLNLLAVLFHVSIASLLFGVMCMLGVQSLSNTANSSIQERIDSTLRLKAG